MAPNLFREGPVRCKGKTISKKTVEVDNVSR